MTHSVWLCERNLVKELAGELEGMQVVDDDGPALPSGPIHVTAENPPLTNTGDDMSGDPGLAVPVNTAQGLH